VLRGLENIECWDDTSVEPAGWRSRDFEVNDSSRTVFKTTSALTKRGIMLVRLNHSKSVPKVRGDR
jgi:hypothetical protein